MQAAQLSLLGHDEPSFEASFGGARRLDLAEGAWVEHVPGWVSGSETLFAALRDDTRWRAERRLMYDREVDVPRLTARIPRDGPGHPLLANAVHVLGERYGVAFDSLSMALYRDGRDSVAPHGDKVLREWDVACVGIVVLGAPRRFLLRPAAGGESVVLRPGWGDLLVMGGTCQRTWRHSVPKTRSAGPRISIMFRHTKPIRPSLRERIGAIG